MTDIRTTIIAAVPQHVAAAYPAMLGDVVAALANREQAIADLLVQTASNLGLSESQARDILREAGMQFSDPEPEPEPEPESGSDDGAVSRMVDAVAQLAEVAQSLAERVTALERSQQG